MTSNGFSRAAAVLTASAALVALGCGVASAATTMPPSRAAVTRTVGSSLGIEFFNNSSYNLMLQSVSGKNQGVPPVGGVLTSGKGSQDFEVTFVAAHTNTVTAVYAAQNDTGTTVGTVTVKFSVNALGARSVTGSSSLPLQTAYVGDGNWELEDSTPTTHNIDATDPSANTVVQQYCNDANNSAQCTFKPATNVKSTQSALLVSGYTEPGGDGTPGTISVETGYDQGSEVNTGGSVTAGLKLGKVFSVSIEEAYGHDLAFDTNFTASEAIDVNPGYTGYIWGQVPVIKYTGTMKVVVGNTTWNIANMVLTSPDPSSALSRFVTGTYQGLYPIGRPDTPPAGTGTGTGTGAGQHPGHCRPGHHPRHHGHPHRRPGHPTPMHRLER